MISIFAILFAYKVTILNTVIIIVAALCVVLPIIGTLVGWWYILKKERKINPEKVNSFFLSFF
jgi:hypothetical protein